MTDMRVLVVDDDSRFRLIVRTLLRRAEGFEVAGEAGDGHEALELARSEAPDAILLDLLMPGMDGFTALPALRRVMPECRIVVLTALDEDQVAPETALVGADAFLEKRHLAELLMPVLLGQHEGVGGRL